MEEMNTAGEKTNPMCKEHTYAQCKETHARYGFLREFSFGDKVCQLAKASIARLETFRECIYNWIQNKKLNLTLGLKRTSGHYAMEIKISTTFLEALRLIGQQNMRRRYEASMQSHGGTRQGFRAYGKNCNMGTKIASKELTREAMKR